MTSMNNRSRTLIAVCFAGLLGGGAAMAQTAPTSAQDDAAQAPVVDQAQPREAVAQAPAVDQAQAQEAVAQTDAADKKPFNRNCLRETGSRIRAIDPVTGKRTCIAEPGNAYSKDDLNSTGQVDIAKALRQLDPAVSVSGH
ncbi:hypothetical protein J2X06_001966 [Lysobacter niastensis]|uniref:Uncharacterized protein n=1 Tax=Lysobacter niastensis TaxID=380629 RepID=A0ABU1WAV2_9GAMM|nr:hypothetical protein [Lysobacter niastensis]MDR7134757.1 hypothetical protein [Lysobacter niastensis]